MGFKVLLVDDETLTRKGIIGKVRWKKFDIDDVEEASDGEEALDKIRSGYPDIVITDIRMPEMDGLSLIKKTLEEGYNPKFIIISAYSEFEYAKNAMSYGVKNYVVKPIDTQKLECIIQEVLKEIRKESETSEQLIVYQQQMLMKQHVKEDLFFTSLFLDNNSESLINTVLKENHISFPGPYFFVAVVAFNRHELLDANEERVYIEIRNIVKKVLEPYNNVLFFRNAYFINEYVFIFNLLKEEDDAYLQETVIMRILKELPKQLGIQAAAGISLVTNLSGNISKAYNQGKSAVGEAVLRGYQKIYKFSDLINEGLVVKEIESSKHVLFSYVLNGKKGAAIKYIHDIFAGGSHYILNHIHLKIFCTQVLIELEKLMRKNNLEIEQVATEKYNFINYVIGTDNTRQMMQSLQEIVVQVIDNLPKDKKNISQNLVMEVVDFINDNYKEEISLKRISTMYYINPNYFCKVFKDITQENFNHYVTKVRLEKATYFMKTTNLSVNEIADMVGFNQKYFCKVFKREFKMTPKEYMLHIHASSQPT